MIKVVSACLLLALVASVYAAIDYKFNGQLITIHKAPYLVQLRSQKGYFCSGTLVTPTHVVTSTLCIEYLNKSDIVVVGGTEAIEDYAGIKRGVAEYFLHPNHRTLSYDVAVLKLDGPLEGSNIETMKLCSKSIPVGTEMLFTGWDLADRGYISEFLRTKTVTTVPFEQCQKEYHFMNLGSTMTCAAESGVKATCHGNRGGPAIYEGELCGIVSWAQHCGQYGHPLLFTTVNKVIDFLKMSLEK